MACAVFDGNYVNLIHSILVKDIDEDSSDHEQDT